MAVDFSEEIKTLRATMDSVRDVTDLDALRGRITDLEKQASVPDLWDDQEKAQEVTSSLSRAGAELERVVGMDQRIEDLETLVEMSLEAGAADGGPEALAEAERDLARLKRDVGELEVRTLLSGEYDEREAVVTIRSGAGG
ncbi:MAG: PCRF domain-containing protein, partial [Actinomycetota bacterium]|nr:PCRF domain-containing protein [Actinomycetota bacterium]